jgi:hypothetical protein
MSDTTYTPTTEEVREAFAEAALGINRVGYAEAFDRWLQSQAETARADQAEKDAQIAETLEPEHWGLERLSEYLKLSSTQIHRKHVEAIAAAIRARAEEEESK